MPDIGERRLATIRRVSNIEPIEGADRIVKATIDGWELVTQKDNGFAPGSLVIYFEIDSFLPVRPEFEFLRKGCFKSTTNLGDGFRIKTIKLKGQVSQGLILPLSDFFDFDGESSTWNYRSAEYSGDTPIEVPLLEEGADLTEYFGVQKYEKPISSGKGPGMGPMHAKGKFPDFVPKTDQERIQNSFGGVKKWIYFEKPTVNEVVLDALKEQLETGLVENNEMTQYFKSGDQWYQRNALAAQPADVILRRTFEATLKLDGSSMTVYHNDGSYGVCSRNWELKRDPESVFWKTVMASGLLQYLVHDGRNLAIQGELMGPGVQGNREELKSHQFYVFDVYDIDQKRYLLPVERRAWITEAIQHCTDVLEHVPFLGFFTFEYDMTVKDFLEFAERKSINHPIAEGVVFKATILEGPSFKAISNTYLLKEKD